VTKDTCIICTRAVKKDQFIPEPDMTQFLVVPHQDDSYTPANRTIRADWRKRVMGAADGQEDLITGMRGDVLVFVHGYNNDIPTVLWRTRTLHRTLKEQGWKGIVIGFDWLSGNSTLNYIEDRSEASKVSLELVRENLDLLVEAQDTERAGSPVCKLNVQLRGHSTGAYVIAEAFIQVMNNGKYFKSDWRIGQVTLIGGDISAFWQSQTPSVSKSPPASAALDFPRTSIAKLSTLTAPTTSKPRIPINPNSAVPSITPGISATSSSPWIWPSSRKAKSTATTSHPASSQIISCNSKAATPAQDFKTNGMRMIRSPNN
jgi:pimeloyl-ACP methyl ester carboxylesterase